MKGNVFEVKIKVLHGFFYVRDKPNKTVSKK